MKEIPEKIFAAITERWDVFFTEEDQWSVYGYIYLRVRFTPSTSIVKLSTVS